MRGAMKFDAVEREHPLKEVFFCVDDETHALAFRRGTPRFIDASERSTDLFVMVISAQHDGHQIPWPNKDIIWDVVAQTPLALLDRGTVGVRGRTLLINLPAGAEPAALFLEPVADLIPAVLAHLRADPAAPTIADDMAIRASSDHPEGTDETLRLSGLDAGEFSAFLKKTASDEGEENKPRLAE